MVVLAFISDGAVVFVIQFFAGFLCRLRLDDLSLDRVGEQTIEAVFAIAHVIVDAGVEASINMLFFTNFLMTFVNSEILFRTHIFYHI
jgi:hypothetical protein